MKHANLAPLTKGRQITGPEREQIAARLRDRYVQGASIRDLMAQTGRSYGWTYRLLRESGAVLRGRGGAHPARHADPAPASRPPTNAPATNPAARTPVTGRAAPTSSPTTHDRNRD